MSAEAKRVKRGYRRALDAKQSRQSPPNFDTNIPIKA